MNKKSNNDLEENKQHTGINVAAFVCGIIAVVSFLFYYLALPTGIVAVVLGAKGAKRHGSGLAKAGLILGIIGLAVTVLVYCAMISAIVIG
jgi:hypothetical protein